MAINDQRSTSEKLVLSHPIKQGLDLTIRQLATNLLKRKKLRFGPNIVEGSIAAIKRLTNETSLWCSHMEYSHSGTQVSFSDLYIDVEMYLQPLSLTPENLNKRAKLKTILKSLDSHLILLGRPGSGKTTAMKALCQSLLAGKSTLRDYFPIPILLRLREVDNTVSLFDMILLLLGIVICDARDEIVRLKDVDYGTKQEIVFALLNENKFVVIFDGFDEIENVKLTFQSRQSDCRTMFVHEFKSLCLNVTASLLILTSRTADFSFYVARAKAYEVSQFSTKQIERYVTRFFQDADQRTKALHEILDRKLLGSEHIPLTLSYLCIIFQKYGRLFNSRRETYNKLLDLLLEEWDLNRQIKRASAFANFDVHDKKRFLRHLSFTLASNFRRSHFSVAQVTETFHALCADYDGLNPKDMASVLVEIETHTGLFVRTGEGYEFSHRTMQECLFALYMFEFPEVPSDRDLLLAFPNELALAVSFNENPSLYLAYLVMNRFDPRFYDRTFLFPFIDRMILEATSFRVHPYLAVSVLMLYTGIRTTYGKMNDSPTVESPISYFFKFLNADAKIDKSFALLSRHYSIEGEQPKKDLLILRKTKAIDQKTDYLEPPELLASYHFYHYFIGEQLA